MTKNQLIESNSIAEYGRLEAERKLKLIVEICDTILTPDVTVITPTKIRNIRLIASGNY